MRSLCRNFGRLRRIELNDDIVFAISAFAGSALGLIAMLWGLPE